MDLFTLCWHFDNRWVFGVNSKLKYLWGIVIVDLLTILGFALEKQQPGCRVLANQIIIGVMVIGHLSVMGICYFKTMKEREKNYANKSEILIFMKRYHIKKTIWSVVGLFISSMSFILLLLECCQLIARPANSYIIYIRSILDICCWIYLGAMVLVFFSCKVWYLIFAWKFPEFYLRYRHVIK